ncbi:MAG: Na+/H+ antiporter NhaA [Woeseiaceae bacterium]|nr:Na+/H+ antiporter NhaA [Woeseiaceae bacterium]
MIEAFRRIVGSESGSGILLVGAAVLALLVANSPLTGLYAALITLPVEVRIGDLEIAKPLLLWINDGLMALFFLLVGLELKRELLEGRLSKLRDVTLPAIGAVGGMLVPAAIYVALNWHDPIALKGWAIPAATDIAFALAILTLLGPRVPAALRVFLVMIAIFDDVGAIVIIALFYTENLSLMALAIAAACLVPLYIMNRSKVVETAPYLLVGVVMWTALLKSGVHATLAGVVLAFMIPLRGDGRSPARELENDLHGAVAYAVLPLFAFANSGLELSGLSFEDILHPIPLGILLGLFVGKQLGIFTLCWLAGSLGIARLPEGMTWRHVYGAAILCGVGFTMSLFIGSLAFEETGVDLLLDERIGILTGSLLSGVVGYLFLRATLAPKPSASAQSTNEVNAG